MNLSPMEIRCLFEELHENKNRAVRVGANGAS